MFWYASCVAPLAARPEMDDVPAAEEAEDAEVPVPERDEGGDPTEVVIVGAKLD